MKLRSIFTSLSLLVLVSAAPSRSQAQSTDTKAVKITEILKRPNPQNKNQDVIVERIEVPPGAAAHPHVHPGMVTGYVVSGILEFQLAGGPLLTLHAGDTFFEQPGSKHIVGRNPNRWSKTVIIAFVLNPKGTPVALPIRSH